MHRNSVIVTHIGSQFYVSIVLCNKFLIHIKGENETQTRIPCYSFGLVSFRIFQISDVTIRRTNFCNIKIFVISKPIITLLCKTFVNSDDFFSDGTCFPSNRVSIHIIEWTICSDFFRIIISHQCSVNEFMILCDELMTLCEWLSFELTTSLSMHRNRMGTETKQCFYQDSFRSSSEYVQIKLCLMNLSVLMFFILPALFAHYGWMNFSVVSTEAINIAQHRMKIEEKNLSLK